MVFSIVASSTSMGVQPAGKRRYEASLAMLPLASKRDYQERQCPSLVSCFTTRSPLGPVPVLYVRIWLR